MGFFDRRKEKKELNAQDRASQREATAAAFALRDTWLGEADKLAAQYSGAISAARSVDPGEMQRTAERLQRITGRGVAGRGTVISARELGEGMGGVGVSMEVQLNLVSGPGAPRPLTIRQDVMGGVDAYPAGLELPVKIDPDNPDDALIWSDVDAATKASAAPAVEEAKNAQIATLEQLRDGGQLTDQQFEDAKARILGA
jgi:hypothetical protein